MKLCRTCGAPMEDEVTFCPMCGAKNEDVNTNGETTVLDDISDETTVLDNTDDETTVLNPNDVPAYVNVSQQPEYPKQKKKLGKGAIIAIVIACVFATIAVIVAAGVIAENNKQRNLDSALNDIEIPEMDQDILDYSNPFSEYLSDLGIVEGKNYTNEKYNFNFHLPSSDWKFMDNQEMAEYHSGASYDDENMKYYFPEDQGKTYYDMSMYNTETREVFEVMILKSDGKMAFTLGDYFEALADMYTTQFDDFKSEDAGIVSFGDTVYSVKKFSEKVNGVNCYQYIAGSKVDDNTIVCVVLTVTDSNANFLEYFSKIAE